MIQTHRGRIADARRYLEAYLRNHAGSQREREMLASLLSTLALQDENELPPAELAELARRIGVLNPEDPKGYLVRATVLMRQKPPRLVNYREAIVLIENAIPLASSVEARASV